jgi:flagellar motility protein MotE (MotC chaperone)
VIAILKHVRLLPVVVVVGLGLLAIKGVDIARAAQNVSSADAADNSGLAPADTAPKPVPDFASDDSSPSSAGDADVLTSLTHRRGELDARERALNMRENLLNAGEGRVDQKITALKALQGQIQALLQQRDTAQDAQIASLVKTYSAMKPKDAARIFNSLSDDVLIPVAKGMKSDVLAPVLAGMNADAAQRLTVKLAALLKLPEATQSAVCPVTTTADAGAPLANPVVTPLQTASLTPPSPVVTPLPTPTAAPVAAPAAAPPAQAPAVEAAAAPAPHKAPPVRHVTPVKPAPVKTATAPPPATKPATASVTVPASKPTTASVTPPATTPKLTTAAATPAATTPAPATTAPAAPAPSPVVTPLPTPPATKPTTAPAATAAPTTLTPTQAK